MNIAATSGFQRISRRIVPMAFGIYIISYLDRVNISFAAPTMSKDLGFTPEIYGFVAGIFFVSYALLEVPSNIIGRRFGTRLWLARIMLSWGVLVMLTAFVKEEWQFATVRVLLGAAEAGAFPLMVLYVTSWVPRARRARALGLFIASIAVAGVIGGPLSGVILSMDGFLGLAGWQWLFIIEALPALIVGLAVWARWPEGPSDVAWLNSEEKQAVIAQLAAENDDVSQRPLSIGSIGKAMKSPLVWLLGLTGMFTLIGTYSITLWLPTFVKSDFASLNEIQLGFVNGLPFAAAIIAMFIVGWSSDRFHERVWHLAIPLVVAGVALYLTASFGIMSGYVCLIIATMGIFASNAVFWAMAPEFLVGPGAVAGFALINSIAALGGLFGPYTVGALVERHGVAPALIFVSGAMFVSAVLAFFVARRITRQIRLGDLAS